MRDAHLLLSKSLHKAMDNIEAFAPTPELNRMLPEIVSHMSTIAQELNARVSTLDTRVTDLSVCTILKETITDE